MITLLRRFNPKPVITQFFFFFIMDKYKLISQLSNSMYLALQELEGNDVIHIFEWKEDNTNDLRNIQESVKLNWTQWGSLCEAVPTIEKQRSRKQDKLREKRAKENVYYCLGEHMYVDIDSCYPGCVWLKEFLIPPCQQTSRTPIYTTKKSIRLNSDEWKLVVDSIANINNFHEVSNINQSQEPRPGSTFTSYYEKKKQNLTKPVARPTSLSIPSQNVNISNV